MSYNVYLSGQSDLNVNPTTAVPLSVFPRDPTTYDNKNFTIGWHWINSNNSNLWYLASLRFNGSSGLIVANWVLLSGTSGDILFLTGNSGGQVGPTAGNVNIVGTGVITVVGTPGTSTLTITPSGSIASSFPTQSGTAIPSAGALTINGSGVISTSASGSTVTITPSGSIATSFITNPATGTATPASGVITLEGTGGTTVTTAGSTIVINSSGGGGSGTVGTLIGAGEPGAVIINTSAQWFAPFGTNSSTKANAQYSCPTAGTISNLYVNIGTNATTNSNTVTINKNGTNTTVVATIPSGTTGVFSDTTHSFTVVAGDTIQFECSAGSTSTAFGSISAEFTAAGAGSGTVTSVAGGNNITIGGTPTVTPIVNVSGTTNHCVQIGNSTGSLTSVANGTTGQVLTAQTGADPIWSSSTSGAMVLIQTQTASSVNTLAFTTGITTAYDSYLLISKNVSMPGAGAGVPQALAVQFSTNGGSSYITSGYQSTYSLDAIPVILLSTGNLSSVSGGSFIFANLTSAGDLPMGSGTFSIYASSGPLFASATTGGLYTAASITVNAIRIGTDNSNTGFGAQAFSGVFSLYGITQ